MKKSLVIAALVFLSAEANAQKTVPAYSNFHRGTYVGVEVAGGISVNERIKQPARNWFYGIDAAVGYRFSPHLVVAAGLGGLSCFNETGSGYSNMTAGQTTSVPVFFRLRSDVLDRRVSPYIQFDLGYSFVILSSRDASGRIRHNDEVFMDRVYALGYGSLSEYETAFKMDAGENAGYKWKEELQRLKQFTNGGNEYIVLDNNNVQYGKNGLFGNLDLGISWRVGKNRMNAGLSATLSQSYYGTCLRTQDNVFLHFGRPDYLPYEKGEEKEYVRTIGQENFLDSFDFDLMLKIGFSF